MQKLRGNPAEKANITRLFYLFALIPEDTCAPLEALLIMFEAVNGDGDGTSINLASVRKWLKILLHRGLVIGSVDQAQVHDLGVWTACTCFSGC